MMEFEEYRDILTELVAFMQALGEYRQDVVVTGGLVPLLYRFCPHFDVPRQSPLLTGDLDMTVPTNLPLRGEKTLRECLENEGFAVRHSRSTQAGALPKHCFYRGNDGELASSMGIFAEFLTPLKGGATGRDGKPKSPKEVQVGLNAEALRYLELLLWKPISLDLSTINELPAETGLQVQLPRPSAYVIQKALCSEKRKRPEKRIKDLAYIFDIAMLSHQIWPDVAEEIRELRDSQRTWRKGIETATANLHRAFLDDGADGPQSISHLYEADVAPETVGRVMKSFLRTVGLSI